MKKVRHAQSLHELQYQKSGFAAQRRYPSEALIQFLARHYFTLPRTKRRRVKMLELGCGSGANLWMVAHEGFDAYGTDDAPTALKLCRKMLKSWKVSAHLSLADMRTQVFPNAIFDAVLDVISMQHLNLEDHTRAYRIAYGALKRGGRFFSYHLGSASSSFKGAHSRLIDRYTVERVNNSRVPLSGNGPICFISAKLMSSMVEKAGFANIAIEKVKRTYVTGKVIEYLVLEARKP